MQAQFFSTKPEYVSRPLIKLGILFLLAIVVSGCSKVNFQGQQKTVSALSCTGEDCLGRWLTEPWGDCSRICGQGDQSRQVQCVGGNNQPLSEDQCSGDSPANFRVCQMQSCSGTSDFNWVTTDWSTCSKTCGIGEQQRQTQCVDRNGAQVNEVLCGLGKPNTEQSCNTHSCAGPQPQDKSYSTTVEPGNNQADILLVVDNSASMAADNLKLAQRLEGFVNEMAGSNIDWQMCITTTDMVNVNGRPVIWIGTSSHIMNQQTINKNTVFTNTIAAIGATSSSDEQGIAAMTTLVMENHETGCIRDDSAFSVILISDENERSVGGNQSWSTAQYQPLQTINMPSNFLTVANQVLGADKSISVNSIIVVPGDTTCEAEQDSQGSPSFFGTLYKQLSDATQGHVGSICAADYSPNLTIVKEKLQNSLSQIELECPPIETPAVTLTPHFTTNIMLDGSKVIFDPVLPENTQVDISFQCLP